MRNLHIPAYGFTITEAVPLSAPWWLSGGIAAANCIAAYQAKGAASLAASYVNLANPGTYNAAPGVAPTWAAGTGWTFDGATQWLTSGVAPSLNHSMIIRFSNYTSAEGRYLCGSNNDYLGSGWFALSAYVGADSAGYRRGVAVNSTTPNMAVGILAICGENCYRNGVADGTAGASSLYTDVTVIIGGRRWGPAANEVTTFSASNIQAWAIYDTPITAPQVVALTTAMNAL